MSPMLRSLPDVDDVEDPRDLLPTATATLTCAVAGGICLAQHSWAEAAIAVIIAGTALYVLVRQALALGRQSALRRMAQRFDPTNGGPP